MTFIIRQGDVPHTSLSALGVSHDRIDKVIKEKQELPRQHGGVTVVEGEATGHHHMYRDTTTKVYPVDNNDLKLLGIAHLFDTDNNGVSRFLVLAAKPTQIDHFNINTKTLTKEHASLPIPEGAYIVSNMSEYRDGVWHRAID